MAECCGAYCFQLLFESKTKSAAPLVRLPWDVLLLEVATADRLRGVPFTLSSER